MSSTIVRVQAGKRVAIKSGMAARIPIWTPDLLGSKLLAWYEMNDLDTITMTGNDVSQVDDKSGNGHHLVQPTAAKQPQFYDDIDPWNGQSCIWFNGSAYEMYVTPNPFGSSISNAEIYLAYREWSRINSTLFTLTGSSVNANRWQSHCPWGSGDIYFDCGGVSSPNRLQVASPHGVQTPAVYGFVCSGSKQEIWVDGTLETSDASSHTVSTVAGMFFGSANGGSYCNGDLAAAIVINGTLTTAERQLVEGYLANGWGTAGALPSGHPYRYGAPMWPER